MISGSGRSTTLDYSSAPWSSSGVGSGGVWSARRWRTERDAGAGLSVVGEPVPTWRLAHEADPAVDLKSLESIGHRARGAAEGLAHRTGAEQLFDRAVFGP